MTFLLTAIAGTLAAGLSFWTAQTPRSRRILPLAFAILTSVLYLTFGGHKQLNADHAFHAESSQERGWLALTQELAFPLGASSAWDEHARAQAFIGVGDLAEAERALLSVEDQTPSDQLDAAYWTLRARVQLGLTQQGHPEALVHAQASVGQALSLSPASPEVQLLKFAIDDASVLDWGLGIHAFIPPGAPKDMPIWASVRALGVKIPPLAVTRLVRDGDTATGRLTVGDSMLPGLSLRRLQPDDAASVIVRLGETAQPLPTDWEGCTTITGKTIVANSTHTVRITVAPPTATSACR